MGFSTRYPVDAMSERPSEPHTATISSANSGWLDVLDASGTGYLHCVSHSALDLSALEIQHQYADVQISIDGGAWRDIGDPGTHVAQGMTHDYGITPFPGLRFESNLSVQARGPGGTSDIVQVTVLYSLEP